MNLLSVAVELKKCNPQPTNVYKLEKAAKEECNALPSKNFFNIINIKVHDTFVPPDNTYVPYRKMSSSVAIDKYENNKLLNFWSRQLN